MNHIREHVSRFS